MERDGEGLRTSFFTSAFWVVPHCLHKALHFALLHIAFSFAASLDCLSLSICQVSPYVLPIMVGYDSLLLVHFLTYQFWSPVWTRMVLTVASFIRNETKADSECGLDCNILPCLYSHFGTEVLFLPAYWQVSNVDIMASMTFVNLSLWLFECCCLLPEQTWILRASVVVGRVPRLLCYQFIPGFFLLL